MQDESSGPRVGELLVDAGVIDAEQLRALLQTERRLLSEVYVRGLAGERQLAELLARRSGTPVAVLTESVVDLDLVRLVPAETLLRLTALPVVADEHTVTVVTADGDAGGLEMQLAFATGRRVLAVLGVHCVLEQHVVACLARIQAGERVYGGAQRQLQGAETPRLEVARWRPPSHTIEGAAALARDILDAAAAGAGGGMAAAESGGLHLKDVALDRDPGPWAAVPLTPLPELPHVLSPREERGSVLIVDADEAVRTMLTIALQHDGVRVNTADDGAGAVHQLRASRPQVLVIDARVPGISGIAICAALKRSNLTQSTAVVMLSADCASIDDARAMEEVHLADQFVAKPFDVAYMRRLIAELLGTELPPAPPADAIGAQVRELQLRYDDYVKRRLWMSADAVVDKWLAVDPFDGRAWLERGNLCAQTADLEGAMLAYEAAAIYAPKLIAAHLGLAIACEELGFLRRARATWLRARALTDDDWLRARIDERLRC